MLTADQMSRHFLHRLIAVICLLTTGFHAVAGGLIVRFAEPFTGREAALTLPFLIAGLVTVGLTVYGFFRLRFPQ